MIVSFMLMSPHFCPIFFCNRGRPNLGGGKKRKLAEAGNKCAAVHHCTTLSKIGIQKHIVQFMYVFRGHMGKNGKYLLLTTSVYCVQ